jgi:hypothetical protein
MGLLAFVYGGISYSRHRTVLDFVPEAAGQHNIPLSPIVGGIAVVGGLVLLALPRRRTG